MSEEFYDEDGFRLTFEDETPDQEKQFFMRAFPNVNKIAERKVHCTSCYMHIGTAPISEAVIRMHPVLRVTHCRNCHTFYNSGEFDKGEDGSELYCRWCGQGGEVYCCSKCPYVFCKKCIVQNLSRACVQDISRNDNWQCFSCAPKIMWHLRAQHWALSNYIEKQKKDMKDKNLSVQAINNMMKQDNTTCCTNKGANKKANTPVVNKKGQKRVSDVADLPTMGTAKIPDKRPGPRPMSMPAQLGTPPSAKKAKTDNNEVVCTPDIMSMFMNPEEPPPLVAAGRAGVSTAAVPKQVVPAGAPVQVPNRQVVVRPAVPNAVNPVPMRMPTGTQAANAVPPPVYHTINGYRIDLHTAAQQGTYRLPNGKLIQVRKQAPTAPPPVTSVPVRNVTIAPKPTTVMYNPASMAQNPRMANGGGNVHLNYAIQQQQQLQEQRLQQQRQQQMLQQQRQQQQQQPTPVTIQPGQPQPTIVAGQINPALQLPTLVLLQGMVNGPHEDSPLGRSRKNFEGKLLSGVEICQHIVNKINTLTNSNSFKNIRNVRDLKELYIHVSYLLTYAIGRFKTLQEKCVDDVKKMGFTKESDFVMMGEQISNRNPEEDKSDDEDDCEIIEQNTTLIEIDSEDEDEAATKKKKKDGQAETEAAVAAILDDKDGANSSGGEPLSMEDFLQVSINESDQTTDTQEADSITEKVDVPKKKDEEMVELIETCDDVEGAAELEKSGEKKESLEQETKEKSAHECKESLEGTKVEKQPDSPKDEPVDKVDDEAQKESAEASDKMTDSAEKNTPQDEADKPTKSTAESMEQDGEPVSGEAQKMNGTEESDKTMKQDETSKADAEKVLEKSIESKKSVEATAKDANKDETDGENPAGEAIKQTKSDESDKAIDGDTQVLEQQNKDSDVDDESKKAEESVTPAKATDEQSSSATESLETADKQPEPKPKDKPNDAVGEAANPIAQDSTETVADKTTEPKEVEEDESQENVLISSSEDAMDVDADSSEVFEAGSIPTEAKSAKIEESLPSVDVDKSETVPVGNSTDTESKASEPLTAVPDSAEVSEESPALEPEVPSPTALFAQMEDSLQKVQEIFESTSEVVDEQDEEAIEEEQKKISYLDDQDGDAEMTEAIPVSNPAEEEQMDVDSAAVEKAVTSEEPLEAPAGTVDTTTAPAEKKNDDNGLEEIVSAENFSQETCSREEKVVKDDIANSIEATGGES